MTNTPILIAEIGCTYGHVGAIVRAEKLIMLAKSAGADVVKFQKRDVDISTPEYMKNKPHPNERFAFGKTYLEHREHLELTTDQHAYLKTFCEETGVIYSVSVWDLPSLRQMTYIEPKMLKIPSARNTDFELVDTTYQIFKGEIHISLGMTTFEERIEILRRLTMRNDADRERTVIYHCTSVYPCPFENLYLNEIRKIRDSGVPKIGFSNHGYGIAADMSALALGANWFERHFIDDRTYPHTDAAASLEPQGMSKLRRDLTNIRKALNDKPDDMIEGELEQRNKLRIKPQ